MQESKTNKITSLVGFGVAQKNIVSIINERYWEITPISTPLERSALEKSNRFRFFQILQKVPAESVYHDFRLGKAKNISSGNTGKLRLHDYLEEMRSCASTEDLVMLNQKYITENPNTKFSDVLATAIIACGSSEKISGDQQSNPGAKYGAVVNLVQQYAKKAEEESERAILEGQLVSF